MLKRLFDKSKSTGGVGRIGVETNLLGFNGQFRRASSRAVKNCPGPVVEKQGVKRPPETEGVWGAKRLFDIFFSLLGVITLSPLFLIISFLVKISSAGPVFFEQNRVGKNGRIFKIYKFRTMQKNAPYIGNKFATPKDDPRITKIGYFLRRTNIDELPQLINVIRGEMSLVGPRPEVSEVVNLYREEYKKILLIKPGMTNFASLEFRREGDILASAQDVYRQYVEEIVPKKIKLNLKYLEEQSLFIDIKLIFKTIFKIIGIC